MNKWPSTRTLQPEDGEVKKLRETLGNERDKIKKAEIKVAELTAQLGKHYATEVCLKASLNDVYNNCLEFSK